MSTSPNVTLARYRQDQPIYGRDLNRAMDMLLGLSGGRIRQLGDLGVEINRLTGEPLTTGNYARVVRSGIGKHDQIRKGDDSGDLWTVQDSGATLDAPLSVSGLLAAAAAATVGTTLGVGGKLTAGSADVTGLFRALAAATVATTLGVGGKLTAGSAEVTGLLQAAAAATVGTTLAVGGHASAGSLSVGTGAPSGSEKLRVAGTTRLEGTTTITTGNLILSSGSLAVNNASTNPLIVGTNVQTSGAAAAGGAGALPATVKTFFYVQVNGDMIRVPGFA